MKLIKTKLTISLAAIFASTLTLTGFAQTNPRTTPSTRIFAFVAVGNKKQNRVGEFITFSNPAFANRVFSKSA